LFTNSKLLKMTNQFVIIGDQAHEVPQDVHKWCIYANDVIKATLNVRRLQKLQREKPGSINTKAIISEEKKLDDMISFYKTKNDNLLK